MKQAQLKQLQDLQLNLKKDEEHLNYEEKRYLGNWQDKKLPLWKRQLELEAIMKASVTLNEVRHSIQKERRICDVLEPIMNSHRLIFDHSVIENDYESCQGRSLDAQLKYQLIFQLSRITRDKNNLSQDDRLDALSMAVQYMVEYLAKKQDLAVDDRLKDMRQKSIDKFMETALGVKPKEKTWINLM